MGGILQVNDREKTAGRLLASSAKNSYDPEVDVDWDAPLDESKPYIPFERSSLYGTELWERLSREQRLELTKHELVSIATNGVFFEVLLMQMLLKEFYDADPTSKHAQYMLTEVGDECRHSTMFAKLAARVGAPAYGPMKYVKLGGKLLPAVLKGPSAYASILVAEEILDRLQRDQMNDPGVQPLVRMVNRIHVLEEARHVTFAREEVVRRMAECGPFERAYHQLMTGLVSYFITLSLIHPRVYRSVGLDPKRAHRVARSNPHYHAHLRWSGEKIIGFLEESGLAGGPGRYWLRKALLIE
ncbi:AurF N-oxygenase family protein [Saccharopolyspora griseoalba]|uniref:Diiron oxygenase n=1 Tax=Saccharopolyspora griseoalba TaxID=1431848 RepID=A0ABW2LL50_9PSEU